MFRILKKRWYLFILVIAIGGFIIFGQLKVSEENKKKDTYKVKKENLQEALSFSGKVDADEKATLRFQTSGRLAWVGVKEGDHVSQYQSIATLDQRDVKQNLQKKLNTFMKSRSDYDETKDDYKDKIVTDEIKRIIDKAQDDLSNSVIDVELQQLSLEYSYLSTPIEGIVTKVASPYAGVNITPTSSEFEIVNPNTVYFSATADQTEVVRLQEGRVGEVVFDSYPENKIYGGIQSISFTPKEGESGTVYEVRVSLNGDNSDYHWRIGMTGDVTFILNERNKVLAVPSVFIKSEKSNRAYVLKDIKGKSEKVYVETGLEVDDMIEVISGLKEGDVVYD